MAQKMSWASGRNTTCFEDEANCLIGLYDVNMPLLVLLMGRAQVFLTVAAGDFEAI